ncbi:MAG: hypothetical protein WDN67_03820 [Candidatus Moraniibacteriota bacterium]
MKASAAYTPEEGGRIKVSAEVKKSGRTELVSLTPGIVTSILVKPGQTVGTGQTLVTLSNDYQGGTAALERQIAQNNAALAEKTDDYQGKNIDLGKKEARNDDVLSDRQEDIQLNTLRIQDEERKVALKNTRLQLDIANRNESVLRPKAVSQSTVEQIHVRIGQFVSAGAPLATLTASKENITAEILIPFETALFFNPTKEALVSISGKQVALLPTFFSTSENQDGLYSVLFTLPAELAGSVSDGSFLEISLPLDSQETDGILVPLDALFQDQARAWTFVEENGHAKSQEVTLGSVYGNFALVTSGLDKTSRILLNRNLLDGEAVEIR